MSSSASSEGGKPEGRKWTHPSFVKLQVERAKKENEEKFKAKPQRAQEEESRPDKQSAFLTYVEMIGSNLPELPHDGGLAEVANPKNYGLHIISTADGVVLPDEREMTTAGYFSLALHTGRSSPRAPATVHSQKIAELEQMVQSVVHHPHLGDARDKIYELLGTLNAESQSGPARETPTKRTNVPQSVVLSEAFRKNPMADGDDRLNLDIRTSLSVPADYVITEEILRRVASNTVEEGEFASTGASMGTPDEPLNAAEWRGNPISYLGYLMTLLDSMTKETTAAVMRKMIAVCSKAIENVGKVLREPYTFPPTAHHPAENPTLAAFPANRCIGYFVALRAVLFLHLGETALALHHLYRVVLSPGAHIFLDFIEQINACVLMVAILTGLVGASTFALSAFSTDFLTIAFPPKLNVSAKVRRAVISVLSKAQKMVDDVNSTVSSPVFQRAQMNLRNLSARFNLANRTDAPRHVLLYHAYMAPIDDTEFLLLGSAAGVPFPVDVAAVQPVQQYLFVTHHLQRNAITEARAIVAAFIAAREASLRERSTTSLAVSILHGTDGSQRGSMGVNDVAAVLLVSLHEWFEGRAGNSKSLLNALLFSMKISSSTMRLVVLKERLALCFALDRCVGDFTAVVHKYIESVDRSPGARLAPRSGELGFSFHQFFHLPSPMKERARVLDAVFRWIDSVEAICESEVANIRVQFLQALRGVAESASVSVPVALFGGRIAHYLVNIHTLPVPRMKHE
ncbi:hypothetical protein XU18_2376 [Perkinsela sp. CCAP 1560/4]|nr:hypothetical protein XU18_2376 [Perkinsela sp. CCAP 1560/4]|eukprot:KNH06866.1 hypothetical protein XU18_2376 [Perkinsela sp. CCAP 1560/4]